MLVLGEVLPDRPIEGALDLQGHLEEHLAALLVAELDVVCGLVGDLAGGPERGDPRQLVGPGLGLGAGGQEGVVLLEQILERSGEGVGEGRVAEGRGAAGELAGLVILGAVQRQEVDPGDPAEDAGEAPGDAVSDLDDLREDADVVEALEVGLGGAALPLNGDDQEVGVGIGARQLARPLDGGRRGRGVSELDRRAGAGQEEDAAKGEEREGPLGHSEVWHPRRQPSSPRRRSSRRAAVGDPLRGRRSRRRASGTTAGCRRH